jgi:hypothetical protein
LISIQNNFFSSKKLQKSNEFNFYKEVKFIAFLL